MIDFNKLKEPFPADKIEWRVQRSKIKDGKPTAIVLAYVQARAIQDRLDDIFGWHGWMTEVRDLSGGIICRLSVKAGDEWIHKEDGSPETKVEAFKGGISKALVRVASSGFGIGRYLYELGVSYAKFETNGIYSAKIDGNWYKWNPPTLPDWALPSMITAEQMGTWTDIASSADISVKDLSLKFGLTKRTTEKDADEMIKQALAHYQK